MTDLSTLTSALIEAVEIQDGPKTLDLTRQLREAEGVEGSRTITQSEVLPYVSIPSRLWFWQSITEPDQFDQLIDAMTTGTTRMLTKNGYALGRDFSIAQEGPQRVLIVTEPVNDWLVEQLPESRYATLQLALRFMTPQEDDDET